MNEINLMNISGKNESLKNTPLGPKESLSNDILYFSVNQDSK